MHQPAIRHAKRKNDDIFNPRPVPGEHVDDCPRMIPPGIHPHGWRLELVQGYQKPVLQDPGHVAAMRGMVDNHHSPPCKTTCLTFSGLATTAIVLMHTAISFH